MTDRNRILHVFDQIAGTMRDLALASERIAARHPRHPDSVDMLQNATLYRSWSDTLRIGVRALAAMDDADAAAYARAIEERNEGRPSIDEREWLEYAVDHMLDDSEPEDLRCAEVLRGLLDRLPRESTGAEQQGQHVEREREREEPDAARRDVERGEQREDERNDQAQESERHEGVPFGGWSGYLKSTGVKP